MKKRRTLVISLLLVAALALGIGYAALSEDLFITGSANISKTDAENSFKEDVYFSYATSGDKAEAKITDDNNYATMTVKTGALKQVGDEAVATFTIKSESDLDVLIKNPTVANGCITNRNNEYFQVTTNWQADHTLVAAPSGATTDITVTVRLIKTPDVDQDTEFTIKLVATANPGSGNTETTAD